MTDRAAIQLAQRAAARRARIVHRELARGLSGLATIAATAAFGGLLLTCLGIIDSFAGSGSTRSSQMVVVTSRVAKALLYNAWGLLLAIFAVATHRSISKHLDIFETEMALAVSLLPAALYPRPSSHSVNSPSPFTSVSRISRL